MGNGEQAALGVRDNWQIRLGAAVGCGVGAAIALFVVRPLVGQLSFWPGLISFCALIIVGGVLGRLAGGMLSRKA